MLCCAVLCGATLCCAVLSCAVLRCAVLRCAAPCPDCAVPRRAGAVLCHAWRGAHCQACCAGTLVGRVAAVAEQVEGLQASLHHKLDKAALQHAKHELQEARQQGQATAHSLTDLQHSVCQQAHSHATSLHRLQALIATCAQGMDATPSPFPLSPQQTPLLIMHGLVTSRRDKTREGHAIRHHRLAATVTIRRPRFLLMLCWGITCMSCSAGCGHVCHTPANSSHGCGVCELQ